MIKPAGNINSCILAFLYKDDQVVGKCHGTLNAVAYGMYKTGADNAKLYYIGFPVEIWDRNHVGEDRIKNAGWFTKDSEAGFQPAKYLNP